MPETLVAQQAQDGKFYLLDIQTGQPVQPRFPFEKPNYDSNEEAVAAAKQRIQMGMQQEPGLSQLNPGMQGPGPGMMPPDGVPQQPMRMNGVMP